MTPELQHDLILLVAYPVLTALLNGAVMLLGKSDAPWAKLLARLGTVALSSTKKQEK